jgi:uncharacterized protein YdaU (DUF1376 family)
MGRQHDDLAVIPWYWRDWRASKARAKMSPLARGVYRELLDAHYGEEDCALPADESDLAILAGVDAKTWTKVRAEILPWLPALPSGRLQNARVVFEWRAARKNRSTTRRKRREAAKVRWDKEKKRREDECKSNARALTESMQMQCPPTPTPTPSASATPSASTEHPVRQANPLVDRKALVAEGHRLIPEIAQAESLDPTEVLRKASDFRGTGFVRLDTMSDDRLARTLLDLRAWSKRLKPSEDETDRETKLTVQFYAEHGGLRGAVDQCEVFTRGHLDTLTPVEAVDRWLKDNLAPTHAAIDVKRRVLDRLKSKPAEAAS